MPGDCPGGVILIWLGPMKQKSATWRLFAPILPGATLKTRLIGAAGALVSISLTAFVCAVVTGNGVETALLVAPMGATAVLLFAVPFSPLAQPWPIIGGNTLSALAGVAVALAIPNETVAAGVAVGAAIALMSFTRCLHPPGGAAALIVVLGGPDVAAAGFGYAFVPVALNAAILTGCGIIFHRLVGQSYPQRPTGQVPKTPATVRVGFNADDIDAAIRELGHALDVSRSDIAAVLDRVQAHTLQRTHGSVLCGDIMSTDLVRTGPDGDVAEARSVLVSKGIRTLPVTAPSGRLLGQVTLRQALGSQQTVAEVMVPAATALPDDDAISLIRTLSDGLHHAVAIVDRDQILLGLVTQTDLLLALARKPPVAG